MIEPVFNNLLAIKIFGFSIDHINTFDEIKIILGIFDFQTFVYHSILYTNLLLPCIIPWFTNFLNGSSKPIKSKVKQNFRPHAAVQ